MSPHIHISEVASLVSALSSSPAHIFARLNKLNVIYSRMRVRETDSIGCPDNRRDSVEPSPQLAVITNEASQRRRPSVRPHSTITPPISFLLNGQTKAAASPIAVICGADGGQCMCVYVCVPTIKQGWLRNTGFLYSTKVEKHSKLPCCIRNEKQCCWGDNTLNSSDAGSATWVFRSLLCQTNYCGWPTVQQRAKENMFTAVLIYIQFIIQIWGWTFSPGGHAWSWHDLKLHHEFKVSNIFWGMCFY